MARRRKAPNVETARRRFTTLQRDPTGKSTRRYAKTRQNPLDQALIGAILDQWAVEHNGAIQCSNGTVRRSRKTVSNGLAAWVIDQYESAVRNGMDRQEAYRRLTYAFVKDAVDNGDVGRWCEEKAKVRVISTDKTRERLRKDGPRKAKLEKDRRRYQAQGDRYRAEIAKSAPKQSNSGITTGEGLAQARDIIRSMGLNPDAF